MAGTGIFPRLGFLLGLCGATAGLAADIGPKKAAELANQVVAEVELPPSDPCRKDPLAMPGDGEALKCFTPEAIKSHAVDSPCDDLFGYLCGTHPGDPPPDTSAGDLNRRQRLDLETVAEDLWIADRANPPNDKFKAKIPGGELTIGYGEGIVKPPAKSLTDLTSAHIAAVKLQDEKAAALLQEQRVRLFTLNGELAQGATTERCANGEINLQGNSDDVRASRARCIEAFRGENIPEQLSDLQVDIGFGRRPRAGETAHPLQLKLDQEIAATAQQQGRTDVTDLASAWKRVGKRFAEIKAGVLDTLLNRSPNLSDQERALAMRLVDDVVVVPPDAFQTKKGREVWKGMCGQGPNAAQDDTLNFVATPGPPLNGDGKFHAHGMIICPATVANVSDEWLENVLAHELGHAIDPGALAKLNQRFFTPAYQNDLSVPARERELYRRLAGGQEGGAPNGHSRTLMTKLYGMGSPKDDLVRYKTLADGQEGFVLNKVAGDDPFNADFAPDTWLHNEAGCYDVFSKCPVKEWMGQGKVYSIGSQGCFKSTAPKPADHCSPSGCDVCFQIQHGQIQEVEADQVSATHYGEWLAAHPLKGDALLKNLRSAFGMHCNGSKLNPNGHPPGSARLNRVIGSNPELRRALGCAASPPGPYQLPCGPGYQGPPYTPSARCLPVDAKAPPDFSGACP